MGVIIGMDPHKRSATIEVIDEHGQVLAVGRYGTDKAGYAQMLRAGRKFEDRVWAIEGCNGIGRHIARRESGRHTMHPRSMIVHGRTNAIPGNGATLFVGFDGRCIPRQARQQTDPLTTMPTPARVRREHVRIA
jgi:hypothetical protein